MPRMQIPMAPATKMIGATPPAELSLELPATYCRGCRQAAAVISYQALMEERSKQTLRGQTQGHAPYLHRKDVLLACGVLIGVPEALQERTASVKAAI